MKSVLFMMACVATPVWGQEGGMTLADAVARARTHAPLVAIASGRRMIAQGRARYDGAFPNPTLEWRRENLNSPLQPDIFTQLQLPLDVTGRRLAIRAAGAQLTARGRADSAATVRQQESDVVRSYWRAALGAELLSIARDEREGRERVADFDGTRFKEGAVAEVVAMRTRLETDRARITEASARGEAARAGADLARALGMHPDSLPTLARVPLLTRLTAPPDESTAWRRAESERPDLAAFRHAAAEAERRAAAERRGVVADLQLVTGYKQTAGFTTGLVGVIVPLPLFSRNEGPRQRTQGEWLVANAELRDAEHRVRGEVSAAIRAYSAMRDAVASGAAGIDVQATEVAQIAEAAYRERATSLIELVEAQRARAESRAAALRWMIEIHLAVLELNRAVGAPLLEMP